MVQKMITTIEKLNIDHAKAYTEHLHRLMSSSGKNGQPIFTLDYSNGCNSLNKRINRTIESWNKEISSSGQKRSWGVFNDKKVAGSTSLKSYPNKAQAHRAVLELGIEADFQGLGYGKKLTEIVLTWAKNQNSLKWIDLNVFARNQKARKLYSKVGFYEVGRFQDFYDVKNHKIDNIRMTLEL